MEQTMNNIRKQVWLLLLPAMMAVAGALWAVQPAAALMPIEVRELVIKVRVQDVDANGDGEVEPFSAYVEADTDGRATGRINIGHAHNITLKRGIPNCVEGVNTAVLEGTLYEINGGTPVEVGDVMVNVSPANGNGGGDIDLDFDIINNASLLYAFKARGTLFLANPPCAS